MWHSRVTVHGFDTYASYVYGVYIIKGLNPLFNMYRMLFCSVISLTKLSYWHSAFNSLKDSYHCLKVHHFCLFLNMNQRAAPYIQQNMSSYWEKFMLLTYRKDWWEILHSNINTSVPVHYIWVLHGFSL